jgi:hypothetical protein
LPGGIIFKVCAPQPIKKTGGKPFAAQGAAQGEVQPIRYGEIAALYFEFEPAYNID